MSEKEHFNELATALAKAQGELKAVPKTGKNPHLDNQYATLDDIIGAVRKPLAENGLSFVQLLNDGEGGALCLRTLLIHESGQSLASTVTIPRLGETRGINSLQALGSSITYMKRYALSAMLGIAVGDDTDGEGAESGEQKPEQASRRRAPQKKPAPPKGEGEAAPQGAKGISSPKELFIAANAEIPYYNDVKHCYNTLRKEDVFDPAFEWNRPEDDYGKLLKALVEYARLNTGGTKE